MKTPLKHGIPHSARQPDMCIMAHPMLYHELVSLVPVVDSMSEEASLLSIRWDVESGGHRRPMNPRQLRICKNSDTEEIGDESHFLLQCPKFGQQRLDLFCKLSEIKNMKSILRSRNMYTIGSSDNGSTCYRPPDSLLLWVLVATFNKGVEFLCGSKFYALNIFCEEYLQPSLCLML